ncbi:hypothetical protein SARC_18100, partial [Sphaeroforma arctica JP610]
IISYPLPTLYHGGIQSYYDTYRAMGDAQMAGGYLHASFRTLADTLQTNEAESGGKV